MSNFKWSWCFSEGELSSIIKNRFSFASESIKNQYNVTIGYNNIKCNKVLWLSTHFAKKCVIKSSHKKKDLIKKWFLIPPLLLIFRRLFFRRSYFSFFLENGTKPLPQYMSLQPKKYDKITTKLNPPYLNH